jgi:hypothetical protein
MIGNNLWIWLIVGLIPYYIDGQKVKSERSLHIRALFWSLEILFQHPGQRRWILHVPFVKRLQHAALMVIKHLDRDNLS